MSGPGAALEWLRRTPKAWVPFGVALALVFIIAAAVFFVLLATIFGV